MTSLSIGCQKSS